MKDTQYLVKFINDVLRDDFSNAKENLQSAIAEKLKDRMKTSIQDNSEKGE